LNEEKHPIFFYWARGSRIARARVTFNPLPCSPLGSLGYPQKICMPKERNEVALLVANKGVGRRSLWLERFGPRGPNRKIWGVFFFSLKNSVMNEKIIFLHHFTRHYVLNESTSFQVYGLIS